MSTNIRSTLNVKYSSAKTHYVIGIDSIVREKRTAANIDFDDAEYLCDDEEYLKRWYGVKEFKPKMFAFKEYYFYQEQFPRIFMSKIQEYYSKWKDKRRDAVFRRLRRLYNESGSSFDSQHSRFNKPSRDLHLTHFLLEISDYNPYSKNYYLRPQRTRKPQQPKQDSKKDLSGLNHQLSGMLAGIQDLSRISTLQKVSSTKLSARKLGDSNSSKRSSSIQFNFKKQKQGLNIRKWEAGRKLTLQGSKPNLVKIDRALKFSPKFTANQKKIKSIFSVSSFGVLNKGQSLELMNRLQYKAQGHELKVYESEKKKSPKMVKAKSTSKIGETGHINKLRIRQHSVGKLVRKTNEFSDRRMMEGEVENKLRSHQSEHKRKKILRLKIVPLSQRRGSHLHG